MALEISKTRVERIVGELLERHGLRRIWHQEAIDLLHAEGRHNEASEVEAE